MLKFWQRSDADADEDTRLSRRILFARFLVFAALSAALGACVSQAYLILRSKEEAAFRHQFFDAAGLVCAAPSTAAARLLRVDPWGGGPLQ